MSYEEIIYLGWILNAIGLILIIMFIVFALVLELKDALYIFNHTKPIKKRKYVIFLYHAIPFLMFFRVCYVIYLLLSNKDIEEKIKILQLENK